MFSFIVVFVVVVGGWALVNHQRNVLVSEDATANWDEVLKTEPEQYGRFNDNATEYWVSCNPYLQPHLFQTIQRVYGQNEQIQDRNTGTKYVVTKIMPTPYWNKHPRETPSPFPPSDMDHAIRIVVEPYTKAWTGLENLNLIHVSKIGPDEFELMPNHSDLSELIQVVSNAVNRQSEIAHSDAMEIITTLKWLNTRRQTDRNTLVSIDNFLGKYSNVISALSLITSLIEAALKL